MKAVVVGGGLAGATAALELASRGSEVTLIAAAPGATALGWGTLDVASGSPLRRGGLPLRDLATGDVLTPALRLRGVVQTNRAHPYATLFRGRSPEDEVKAAAAALDAWLAPDGPRVHGSLDQTSWFADVHGSLRAGDLAFGSVGHGDLAGADEVALVDVPGLPGFEATSALRRLAAELTAVGFPAPALQVLSLDLPPALREVAAQPARFAAILDRDEVRAALRAGVAALGGAGRLLLFPPVLGLSHAEAARSWAQEAAGCRVAELVGAPELTLAGYRLQRGLDAALARAGVARRAARVARVESGAGRVRAVCIADGESLACEALVLATGRFVGGGVGEREGGLAESLVGLPLHDVGGRRVDGWALHRLVRRDYEGEQPLFSVGVRTDARLRPLGADAAPHCANLFAAGDLLGGFDPARDRTGLGVALVSGRRAGIEASAC